MTGRWSSRVEGSRPERTTAGAGAECGQHAYACRDGEADDFGATGLDVELAAEGWRRRFVGGPPRLDEMVTLYRELGHEVRLELLDDRDLGDECAGCRLALSFFRIVYTRITP